MYKKHGLRKHRLYRIYAHIKERCFKPKTKHYQHYGGRGITMCEEWKNDFTIFYEWAIANGYENNLTIDRENNDGHYEPNNCRWVTYEKQSLNKRNTIKITYNGETLTLHEWALKTGINYRTLYCRLKTYGYSMEELFNKAAMKGERQKKKIMIHDKNNKPLMIVESKAIAAKITQCNKANMWRQMQGIYSQINGYKFSYVIN